VSFPEIEAKEYRIVFHNKQKEDIHIKQIRLSATPIIDRYAEKLSDVNKLLQLHNNTVIVKVAKNDLID
ncbi:hypothetical protein EZS27_031978, partial [termite gut metagenome]